MKYFLDTNTCIRYLNQRTPNVIARLHAVDESAVVLCSVVRPELYFGALKSQTPESTITRQRTLAALPTSSEWQSEFQMSSRGSCGAQ